MPINKLWSTYLLPLPAHHHGMDQDVIQQSYERYPVSLLDGTRSGKMPNGLLIFKFPHSILWCRVDARGKNTLSTKFWLYIVQYSVVFGVVGFEECFLFPSFVKGGGGGGSRILPLLIYCKGCIDVWGRHQGRSSRKFMIPISECLSIHSNYTITTYIQELYQGLVQHLSKCNTVGKRFNAFG